MMLCKLSLAALQYRERNVFCDYGLVAAIRRMQQTPANFSRPHHKNLRSCERFKIGQLHYPIAAAVQ
jgi:hypothetical protein